MSTHTCSLCGLRYPAQSLLDLHIREDHAQRAGQPATPAAPATPAPAPPPPPPPRRTRRRRRRVPSVSAGPRPPGGP